MAFTGIVVGYLQFKEPEGTAPVFAPNPQIYQDHGETPPEVGCRNPEKEKKLQAMLDDAAGRGWRIMTFGGAMSPAAPVLVDHEARTDAKLALQAITQHMGECTKNQTRIEETQKELSSSIRRVHGRIDKLLWAVICGFGAVVLTLLAFLGAQFWNKVM